MIEIQPRYYNKILQFNNRSESIPTKNIKSNATILNTTVLQWLNIKTINAKD